MNWTNWKTISPPAKRNCFEFEESLTNSAENNIHVTTREFYDALREMDARINHCLDGLLECQTRTTTIAAAHEKRLDKHESDIEKLEGSDRKWAGISGLVAALLGAIAGWWGRG